VKRHLLACVILAVMTSAASAQISDNVVRIGVLTDLSSWGRDNSGPGSVEAARMAVEEFGPTVLGKPIEIVSADHQMKTDVGTQIVRDWFDNGKVDAVADIPNSGVAIAVHNMVRERNKIALLSGPGASSLTNELCSPNTVHFTYDTYALSKVTASAVIKEGGKSWFFVTADYAFGHQLEADATHFIKEQGGTVLGSVRHPTNTADFSSFALQAQSSCSAVSDTRPTPPTSRLSHCRRRARRPMWWHLPMPARTPTMPSSSRANSAWCRAARNWSAC